MCEFLGSLTRLEPTATGGELRFACAGIGVRTGGLAHSSPFFVVRTGQEVQHLCASSIFHENAWICARQTTDHDLVCVIPDVKGKERKGKERRGKERKGKERKGKERKGKERREKGKNANL